MNLSVLFYDVSNENSLSQQAGIDLQQAGLDFRQAGLDLQQASLDFWHWHCSKLAWFSFDIS